MNLKENISKMSSDSKNFLLAIVIAGSTTYLLTFIEIWQLILIPGVMAGALCYKKPREGIYGAAIGITIAWAIYMGIAMLTRNAYINFDQFAGLIFGSLGYGWVIILIVLLCGMLFGALGGAIGAGTTLLIKIKQKNLRESSEITNLDETEESNDSIEI